MTPADPDAVKARFDLLVLKATTKVIREERERLAALRPRRRRTAADLLRVEKAKRGAAARHRGTRRSMSPVGDIDLEEDDGP